MVCYDELSASIYLMSLQVHVEVIRVVTTLVTVAIVAAMEAKAVIRAVTKDFT